LRSFILCDSEVYGFLTPPRLSSNHL